MQDSPRTVGNCSSIQQTESKQATKRPQARLAKQVIGTDWTRISLIGTHIIQGNMEHKNYWASGRAHIIDKRTRPVQTRR